jgi:hypothetical protein
MSKEIETTIQILTGLGIGTRDTTTISDLIDSILGHTTITTGGTGV